MTAKVTDYELKASSGKHIRKATMVTFEDGTVIRFTEKMSKAEAIRQAEIQKKQTMKVYMLLHNWSGDEFTPKCTFHAKNDSDAKSKANAWARYHTFSTNDVAVREATPEEANQIGWMHDDWL
jgi:hypothetical protein